MAINTDQGLSEIGGKMKPFKAWIIMDGKKPLLMDDRVNIFWLKARAQKFINKQDGMHIEKVEVSPCSTK